MDLYNKKKNDGYRELDFFVLRMIKLNAQSETAPYRAKNKPMPVDRNVDYTRLDIEDKMTDQIDISGLYLKRFNLIQEIVDRLDLSRFEKDVYYYVFVERSSISESEFSDMKSAYTSSMVIKHSISFILFINRKIPSQPVFPKHLQKNKRFYELLKSYFIANEDILEIINTKQLI